MGHRACKVNLNFGDQLLSRDPDSLNYRGTLDSWKSWFTSLVEERRVSDIILLGEQREYHRVAIKIARERGIEVVVTDFGYLRPDWITFERDGMSAESAFPRDPAEVVSLAGRCEELVMEQRFEDSFFNQACWDILYNLAAIIGWPLYPGYDNFRVYNPVQDYLGILVRLLRRRSVEPRAQRFVNEMISTGLDYFVYPLQIQRDYSIQAYSPYSGNEQPMEEILLSFAQSAPEQAHLIIKIHPLDPNPFKWKRMVNARSEKLGLAGRVHFLDGGDLNRLLKNALGVITINSTTGITALQLGIPTRTLGDSVYNIDGLVSRQQLHDFWGDPQPPNLQLRNAFVRALAGTVQLKGTYYRQPGLNAAVDEAAQRLHCKRINQPLTWRS